MLSLFCWPLLISLHPPYPSPIIHPSIHPSLPLWPQDLPTLLLSFNLCYTPTAQLCSPRSPQITCLPQLCSPALSAPQPARGLLQRCISSIDLLLLTMCECLRGIFRVTWTPSSSAGQDESVCFGVYEATYVSILLELSAENQNFTHLSLAKAFVQQHRPIFGPNFKCW